MTFEERLERIDEIINDFVADFGCDAELDDSFCIYPDESTIAYTLVVGELSDIVWREYVQKTFGYAIENIFVFSLLHEIGHHFTMKNFSSKVWRKEKARERRIEARLRKSKDENLDRKFYLQYFDLPSERTATKWAVNYAKKNKDELENFWNILNKELQKFYAENLTE